jgi:dienelactone hydrolase
MIFIYPGNKAPVRGGRIGVRWIVGWLALLSASWLWSCSGALAAQTTAGLPAGLPSDLPAAATAADPTLPEPSATAWPFPNTFPLTSGTGRLAGGASLWSDFIYDAYGASSPEGVTTSTYAQSSGLAGRQGSYVYPAGAADNNGADIFRAAIGLKGAFSYFRVDWVTLADPSVPIAEWTFDTDDNPSTGASIWPAAAGVSSPGIDQALVVSSRGAWLINPITGLRTDVLTNGGSLTVDPTSKSFIVAIPRTLLPVSGTWRVRLGAGLADPTGQNFAAPYVNNASIASPTAERLYNITFRTVAQEPPVYTDASSDALIAATQAALAGNPVGNALGADGIARSVTGNFWMEDDQADTLAAGDVSKFSLTVDWSQLAGGVSTPEPQPTGYSARWYVSRLHPGSGQVVSDGPEGNFKPTLLEQVQPYAVYVPTGYHPGSATPLTWILHSLEVNYNQYGALDPQLIQQLCEDRDSICATTEGFGPAGWYYNEAETDFWQVWRQLAEAYTLDPSRTLISGYSMGGWASYKLAFEHPDDFAGALVLDGPVICGVGVYPGVNGPAYSDPACSEDGQSRPLVGNARWIPYVIDQTYGDELVPTTGVLAQAQAFDTLGQRYDLFIHTGGDHLAFATEDRFSDVVNAIGKPTLTTDPGTFSYDWYPSLNSAAYGIGATGDYWLSGLGARTGGYGTVASIAAHDAALPDPAITPIRSGTTLVTQPLPGTETKLSWQLGPAPASRRAITLKLSDVSALTLDAAAARLPSGTINVTSDGPVRLSIDHLQRGISVSVDGRRVTSAGADGTAVVSLPAQTHVVVIGAQTSSGAIFSCARPSGLLGTQSLGPIRLGMTRRQARSHFARSSTRGHRYEDFFCPARRGIRVGYASPALTRHLSPREGRLVAGRVVIVLTASHHFALRGVRVGTRVARVMHRLHPQRPYLVGRNRWYVVPDGSGRGILKVQHGIIDEIGIANRSLISSRSAGRRFFRSFS